MIAAVYCRKSTDQSGVSDDQKSVARQYAERKGWTVAEEHVYVDDGISGAEFTNRPGFLRLMNALKPRPAFNVLIMSEESRLGREAIETAYALKQLVTSGVRVFFYFEDRERTLDSPPTRSCCPSRRSRTNSSARRRDSARAMGIFNMSDDIPLECPTCTSPRVASIVYGFVDVTKLADDLDTGRVILGGCDLSASSHRWHCNSCGREWGDFAAVFEHNKRQWEEQQAHLDAEALARGVMDASLYPDGWVLCPHCSLSFNSNARMWDGEKHVTCGTYLRLVPRAE